MLPIYQTYLSSEFSNMSLNLIHLKGEITVSWHAITVFLLQGLDDTAFKVFKES